MIRRNHLLLVRVLFTGIFFLLTFLHPGDEAFANQAGLVCSKDFKVMPLGDSITTGKYSGNDSDDTAQGALDDIGYRKDLWGLLSAAGFSVDFVGTQSNGNVPAFPFSDPEHEGHNGWTAEQIADNIYNDGGENWLSKNPADIILLHIGTNFLDTDASDVERILDEIDEYEAYTGLRVIVILARIIDMVPNNPVVNQFNDNVEVMAAGRSEYGIDLFMVDMEDGAGLIYDIQPAGDMWDNLHPFATGYTKMAAKWMAAFDDLCHDLYLPVIFKNFEGIRYSWE